MLKLELDGTMWYGFDKDSKHVAISNATLLDWAATKGIVPEIKCSSAIVLHDGTRLVRGAKMVHLAESHGWNDIAEALAKEIAANVKGGP